MWLAAAADVTATHLLTAATLPGATQTSANFFVNECFGESSQSAFQLCQLLLKAGVCTDWVGQCSDRLQYWSFPSWPVMCSCLQSQMMPTSRVSKKGSLPHTAVKKGFLPHTAVIHLPLWMQLFPRFISTESRISSKLYDSASAAA